MRLAFPLTMAVPNCRVRSTKVNKIPMLIFIVCWMLLAVSALTGMTRTTKSKQGHCTVELEEKFLPKHGKCRYSGRFPVKGTCRAYILCISLGGDLMKPLQKTGCNPDQLFDIELLRCMPVQNSNSCLQRDCYPEETRLEDITLLPDAAFVDSYFGNRRNAEERVKMSSSSEHNNNTSGKGHSASLSSPPSTRFRSVLNYKFCVFLTIPLLIRPTIARVALL